MFERVMGHMLGSMNLVTLMIDMGSSQILEQFDSGSGS